jgi:hypothetical protein
MATADTTVSKRVNDLEMATGSMMSDAIDGMINAISGEAVTIQSSIDHAKNEDLELMSGGLAVRGSLYKYSGAVKSTGKYQQYAKVMLGQLDRAIAYNLLHKLDQVTMYSLRWHTLDLISIESVLAVHAHCVRVWKELSPGPGSSFCNDSAGIVENEIYLEVGKSLVTLILYDRNLGFPDNFLVVCKAMLEFYVARLSVVNPSSKLCGESQDPVTWGGVSFCAQDKDNINQSSHNCALVSWFSSLLCFWCVSVSREPTQAERREISRGLAEAVPFVAFQRTGLPRATESVPSADLVGLRVVEGFLGTEAVADTPLALCRYVRQAAKMAGLHSWAGTDGLEKDKRDILLSKRVVFCAPHAEYSSTDAKWVNDWLQEQKIGVHRETRLRDIGIAVLGHCGIDVNSSDYIFSHSNHAHSIFPPHMDVPDTSGGFGQYIVTLNVRGSATVVISDQQRRPLYRFRLRPGDCYIMSGTVRHKFLHSVFPDTIAKGPCWGGCGSCRMSINVRFSRLTTEQKSHSREPAVLG